MVETDIRSSVAAAFRNFSTRTLSPAKAREMMDLGRTELPVPYSEELGGFHIFRNYKDVSKGMINWRLYGSAPSVARPLPAEKPEDYPRTVGIHYDPPEHQKWRKLMTEGLNPDTPKRARGQVEADVRAIFDSMAAQGGGDFVADLAVPVPVNAICYVIGYPGGPEEKKRIVELSKTFISKMRNSDEYVRNFRELGDIGIREIEARGSEDRGDFISFVSRFEYEGCPLSRKDLNDTMATLFAAGHGTTANAIGGMLWEVLTRPGLLDRLKAEPDLVPVAIEESLRLHAPFFGLYRTAREDHEIQGTHIRAGESVLMSWQGANLDPAEFEAPHEFRLDRPHYQHLTFGRGRHACVGSPTARMELDVVLRELIRRPETFRLKDPHGDPFEFEGSESVGPVALTFDVH